MRILLINTVRFNLNGISTYIMNLYEYLNKQDDINCDIVANECFDSLFNKRVFEKGKVFLLPSRKHNPLKYLKELKKIKNNNYDIVHIHGNSSTMILESHLFNKNKVIVHCHNVKCNNGFVNRLFYPFFKNTFNRALACSNEAGKFLFKKNYEVVLNGINTKMFSPNEEKRIFLRKNYNIDDKIVLLSVGRFNSQKNQKFLLDMLSAIKNKNDYILFFIGDGDLLDETKRYSNELGLQDNTIFIGNTDEVHNYYSMADVFVLPSFFESFGIVLLEAQINGLNCICSDSIPHDAVITNNVDFIPLNLDLWIKNVNEKKIRRKLTNYSDFAEQFDIECCSEKILKEYRKIK